VPIVLKIASVTAVTAIAAFCTCIPASFAEPESQETQNTSKVARIIINLEEQRLFALDSNGFVLHAFPISSGKAGYGTPTGSYKIYNKHPSAYSRKYSATMTNWMALTPDGAYGIHGLLGWSYYKLIGTPASHGCIRLKREDAKKLYADVSVGIPVDIVKVPPLNLPFANTSGTHLFEIMLIESTLERLYGDASL
jgi:lipoprotein-anchoring transpeptidase ErfK/SrfK